MNRWILGLLVQICADMRQVDEAVIRKEVRNDWRLQFRMMFLFELQICGTNGGLMTPKTIVGKLPRVNILVISGL